MNRCISSPAKRNFKDSLFGEFARIGKAMANGHRLKLIELLAQGTRTVQELSTERGNLYVANTSQHLQILRQGHLVETTRQGTYVRYRPADEKVAATISEARLAEVERLVDIYQTLQSPVLVFPRL